MARVLVVDDEEHIRELIRLYLHANDHFVEECENGAEALELLSKKSFDVLITDMMMPDTNGFSLIEKTKNNFRDLKIIVISGWFNEEELIQLKAQGVRNIRAVLQKPFYLDQFQETFKQVLKQK